MRALRWLVVGIVLVACASADRPGRSDLPRAPKAHRATRPECVASRPATEPTLTPSITSLGCTKSSDCNAGRNGRCIVNGSATKCVYDACVTSADCPGVSVCECGDVNVCVNDGCLADADCGRGGYCSASACGAGLASTNGLPHYCHTTEDQCLDDSDCAGIDVCRYQSSSKTWRCETSTCH